MSFEWDPAKAAANVRKHRVHFAEAQSVFEDDYAVTVRDETSIEERFVTVGLGFKGRVLVVVYCYRGRKIRIISARLADSWELAQYEDAQ